MHQGRDTIRTVALSAVLLFGRSTQWDKKHKNKNKKKNAKQDKTCKTSDRTRCCTTTKVQRFIKHFLPVVFITLINMVTYLLNYDEYMARITICIGTLTALVMFHVSMACVLMHTGLPTPQCAREGGH